MTLIRDQAACLCGRCPGAGDRWCGGCGRPLFTAGPTRVVAPTPVTPPPPSPPARPGTITAARVMMALSMVGDAFGTLVGILGAVVLGSLQRSVVDPDDAGALTEGHRLVVGLLMFGGVALVLLGVTVWAFGGIGRGDPGARLGLSVAVVVGDLAGVAALAIAGGGVGAAIASMPFSAVLLVLLWGPEDSRRHFMPAREASRAPHGLDAPTTRIPLRGGPSRPLSPYFLAVGAIPVLMLVVFVAMVVATTAGSALTSQAEGTWSCQALGDEDQDVYGTVNQAPFEVIIGDGTFSMPSRSLSGTWSLSGGTLSVESTWSKVASRPHSALQIRGIPGSPSGAATGTAPMTNHPSYTSTSFAQNLEWSYSPGHLTVSGGTGIARTGVDCTKESDGTT